MSSNLTEEFWTATRHNKNKPKDDSVHSIEVCLADLNRLRGGQVLALRGIGM
jgi:hypothetical protein